MVTKETMDRIKLSIWDAFMLWASSIYIGVVIYFLEKYNDSAGFLSLLPLIVVSLFIFPFLTFLFYQNRRVKKKYGRSED